MPYLTRPEVCYKSINEKNHNSTMAEILQLYVVNLENKVYPMDEVYPGR